MQNSSEPDCDRRTNVAHALPSRTDTETEAAGLLVQLRQVEPISKTDSGPVTSEASTGTSKAPQGPDSGLDESLPEGDLRRQSVHRQQVKN